MSVNRREFLMGCSSAIAAMAGGQLSNLALAGPNNPDGEMLVVVFLRGGWDALSVLPPLEGPDRGFYEAARPKLKIPTKGDGAAISLNGQLGLHPSLAPLMEFYRAGQLAVIPAAGMAHDTRSHFDAMEFIELGTPGSRSTKNGWITRLLEVAPSKAGLMPPAFALGDGQPTSLQGRADTTSISNLDDFKLTDDENHRKFLHASLQRMWSGDSWMHQSGTATVKALNTIAGAGFKEYQPAGGVKYPEGSFADSLKSLARIAKRGVGLRVATVDLGGWDTHQWQGEGSQGYFADLLKELGAGLAAFYADLAADNLAGRTTVMVLSEFGRRLAENASYGTDHGHGSAMLVLGGKVAGGKVYGRWPGLATEQLYDRADLAVTTDYRQVVAEVIGKQFGATQIDRVFPNFKMGQALGLMRS